MKGMKVEVQNRVLRIVFFLDATLLFGPFYLSIFEKGASVQTIAKINVSEESCARTCLNQATCPSDEGLLQFSLAGTSKFREFDATVVLFLEERLPLDLQQDFSESIYVSVLVDIVRMC